MIMQSMPYLEASINEESYEYLVENNPKLAHAVAQEVRHNNASPEAIRRFVMRYAQRPNLALRLEQAAAHLVAQAAEKNGRKHPLETV